MIPPIPSPSFISEWTDAILHLELENIKILLNFDRQLLWAQLPYTLDHENELYIDLIQSLRLGSSVQPLSALQYCIIHYHQSENREEKFNIISYLIEQATVEDLNTHYWGDCNNSTLHLVCFTGQLDVLDLLLKKDVCTSIKNNLGFSPCHVASNQAILDGLSFYEQKKEQQQQNSGTNTALQKFKMLRDLVEESKKNKSINRPAFNPHYFRTGYVKEAKKCLTTEAHEERKAHTHIEEVTRLQKKSAVKNNLKQFEKHDDPVPQQHHHHNQVMHRRRLSFHPIDRHAEASRRDSVIISALKKNNLVSSSTLRLQLNGLGLEDFTEESIIAELYSTRPLITVEEPQSEIENPEAFYVMDNGPTAEEEVLEKDIIINTETKDENSSTPVESPVSNHHPSTTESVLDEYTPTEADHDDTLDIEMCRKVLRETKIIEDEINLLLEETKGSSSGVEISSDDNQVDSDAESFHSATEKCLEEEFIETHPHQELEQDVTILPSSRPVVLSSPTPSFCIDYDGINSRKQSDGSQRAKWTTSLILWSSNLEDDPNKSRCNMGDTPFEIHIEEEEQQHQYSDMEQCSINDPVVATEETEQDEKAAENEKEEEEEDLREFRNTLDITDEDMALMIRSSSIRKAGEKGGMDRSSTDLNAGLLSTEDLLSGTSSARSSSSIKTIDAIFYTPDPPDKKQPDSISDFYPPPPPPPARSVLEVPPENYHTCEQKQGQLNVHVRGVQDIMLPLPKEPTLVCCVISDGRFEYISDYKKLEIDIEFDHKCSIDVYPGMSITVSLHVHPDYISTPKAQSLVGLWKKHRNGFSSYVSKDDGAIGLAFCDISSCLPVCREEYYRASICCFNTWYSRSFIERHTRKRLNEDLLDIVGKFDLDMFYSPATC